MTLQRSRTAARKRGVVVAAIVGVVLVALLATGAATHLHARRAAQVVPAGARAPAGVRVRVEVLNGTKVRGLARRGTMFLRDRGFDVVEMGTSDRAADTTLVIDRTGHPEWTARLARALAPARVESRPDSSRYLDVTVVLGATWRAPAQPFYP